MERGIYMKKRLSKKVALRREKEIWNLIYKFTLQEMECCYEREFSRLKNVNVNQLISELLHTKKEHDNSLVKEIWNLRSPSLKHFKPSDITSFDRFYYYACGGPGERYKWNPFLYFLERKVDFYSDHNLQLLKDANKRKPYLHYKGIKYEKTYSCNICYGISFIVQFCKANERN